ncbi:hypothetical protein IAQ61_009693 [Plenodomus lingam]|uniref:uncharacterized protein n=1 Tax=Leptosphaeria maculans TaxID=5022 RepID=UPI00331B6768|nr:hypothetical protein IAQ61_009693 [Plenodomus lingam]
MVDPAMGAGAIVDPPGVVGPPCQSKSSLMGNKSNTPLLTLRYDTNYQKETLDTGLLSSHEFSNPLLLSEHQARV